MTHIDTSIPSLLRWSRKHIDGHERMKQAVLDRTAYYDLHTELNDLYNILSTYQTILEDMYQTPCRCQCSPRLP
jgi:hypothetical protein